MMEDKHGINHLPSFPSVAPSSSAVSGSPSVGMFVSRQNWDSCFLSVNSSPPWSAFLSPASSSTSSSASVSSSLRLGLASAASDSSSSSPSSSSSTSSSSSSSSPSASEHVT